MPPFSDEGNQRRRLLLNFNRIAAQTNEHLKSLPQLNVRLPNLAQWIERNQTETVVCLARGPSFFQHDYLSKIAQARQASHRFKLIATDGTVAHCLEHGVIPDLVTSVDPSERILRWVGDVQGITDQDGYFLKDRDAPRVKKALYDRQKVCSLLDEGGFKLNFAIGVFTSEKVLDRLMEINANVYLFVPLTDDEKLMDELWGKHPNLIGVNCVPPDTLIWSRVPTPISTFDGQALASDSKCHPAMLITRQYEGPMISIKARGQLPTQLTPEHPILVTRPKDYLGRTLPYGTETWRNVFHHWRGFKFEWIAAKDVRPGDVAVSTRLRLDRGEASWLKVDNTKGLSRRAIRAGKAKLMPHTIPLNQDVGWFLGLYAADGSTIGSDHKSGSIALTQNDSEGIERTRQILRDYFNLEPRIREINGCTRINFYSSRLMKNLIRWCGTNSENKHLPSFSINSESALLGVLHGDGSTRHRRYGDGKCSPTVENKINTVSRVLANQVYINLLNRFEHPRITVVDKPRRAFKNQKPIYDVRWVPRTMIRGGYWTRWYRPHDSVDAYYLMPVTEVVSTHYSGSVYNLSVPNIENYVANGLILHNCGGNTGGCAYSIAQALKPKTIALLGYDMGYPPGTPLEQTQYFDLIAKYRTHVRGQPSRKYREFAKRFFITVKNPHLRKAWFTDSVYAGYADWMEQMAEAAGERGIVTVNCTGGGICWRHMEWGSLTDFLKKSPVRLEA